MARSTAPIWLVGLLIAASLGGCGYHFVHQPTWNRLQPDGKLAQLPIHTVVVEPFEELAVVGLAPFLADTLSAYLAAGGLKITPKRVRADAILRGKIHGATTAPAATTGRIQAYTLAATMTAELVTPEGVVLWSGGTAQDDDFSRPEATHIFETLLATEAGRRQALRRVADRAARALYGQLMQSAGEAQTRWEAQYATSERRSDTPAPASGDDHHRQRQPPGERSGANVGEKSPPQRP